MSAQFLLLFSITLMGFHLGHAMDNKFFGDCYFHSSILLMYSPFKFVYPKNPLTRKQILEFIYTPLFLEYNFWKAILCYELLNLITLPSKANTYMTSVAKHGKEELYCMCGSLHAFIKTLEATKNNLFIK